jgi:hypothetical protein
MPMDTPALPESPSNPLALSSIHNGEPPAILLSGQNSEATSSPPGLPKARQSQVELENPTNLPSSRISGDMKVSHSGMNRSSPFHQKDLQFGYDCDVAAGSIMAMYPTSGGADNRQDEVIAEPGLAVADHSRNTDKYSSGVQPTAELTCVDACTALDDQFPPSPVHIHADRSTSGMIPSPKPYSAERQLSYSPPSLTGNPSGICTLQVDTCPSSGHVNPQSSTSAHENLILPPCESPSTSDPADMTTRCGPSLSHESQGLRHQILPRPPPEVAALLTAECSGDVVSPVFARNSPLVPWELSSEIGHFWSGLFKISEIKVTHVCYTVRHMISLCCGSVCSPGRNESATKHPELTYSEAYLAIFSGMDAWRRGSTPG